MNFCEGNGESNGLFCYTSGQIDRKFLIPGYLAYLGNKLWQHLPQEIKQSNSFTIFKNKLDFGMVENATVGSAKYISRKLDF